MDFDMMKLVSALEASMNPSISNVERSEALQYCNSLKNSQHCTYIGLQLVQQSNLNDRVRYFGLELLKFKTKMTWISMTDDEKNKVKGTMMELASSVSTSHPRYFLNAYATILTEIVKHTWPQAWPGMLDEVTAGFISPGNAASIEVALVMLSNLVEDICLYQNVHSHSRLRDLKQAMSLATDEILKLLTGVLEKFIVTLQTDKSPQSVHVVSVVLKTTLGYAEWARAEGLMRDDYFLFKMLCTLLLHDDFRLEAAECLLAMASRRGRATEKAIFVKLAELGFVEKYKESIAKLVEPGSEPDSNVLNYLCKLGNFLAKLVELAVELYNDSTSDSDCVTDLQSFQALFELLFWFVKHESRFISHTAIQAWLFLVRGDSLHHDPVVAHCAVGLIGTIAERVTNQNQNLTKNSPYADLEEMEINDEGELAIIYKKHKTSMAELFRECVKNVPEKAIQSCLEFAKAKLDIIRTQSLPKEDLEMVSFFFENGLPHAVLAVEESKVDQMPFAEAQSVLTSYLSIRIADPLCSQFLLIVVYKLVDMLTLSSNPSPFLKALIDYILEILSSDRFSNMGRDKVELRRHCCAVMLKMVKNRAPIFTEFFNHIKSSVYELMSLNKLITFEKTSMFEVLVMISGECDDPSIQKGVIVDGLRTFEKFTDTLVDALKSPRNLINACGFGDTSVDTSSCFKFRQSIHYMLTITTSLMKRARDSMTKWNVSDNDLPCMSPEVLKAVNHCFALIHHISFFWSPDMRQYINPDLHKALDEKKPGKDQTLQAVSNTLPYHSYDQSDTKDDEACKLQMYLFRTNEQCYMLLGVAGPVLRSNFYKDSIIKDVVVNHVLSKIDILPMSQLKVLMRQFLTEFVKSCPPMYLESVALPILSDFCRYMIERLHPEWEKFAQLAQTRLQGDDGNNDQQAEDEEKVAEEIFKEMQLRVVSREYLDFLISLCVNKTPPSNKAALQASKTDGDKYRESVNSLPIAQLTELGTMIAPTPAGEQIWNTALLALTWDDTVVCSRAAALLGPTLKLAFKTCTTPMSETLVRNLFEGVLRGFSRHGNNSQGEQALFPIAMAVVTRFSDSHRAILTDVLKMALPDLGANIDDFFANFNKTNMKKRKNDLKKLIGPIVQQHVSQRFRDIPDMNQYGSINVLNRKPKRVRFDEEAVSGVALLFQPDSAAA